MNKSEKLKNLLNRISFLFVNVIFFMTVFACSFRDEDSYVLKKNDYVYISFSLDKTFVRYSYTDLNHASRTILPNTINLADTTKYCFYIWGKSRMESITPRKVDIDTTKPNTGTIELDFPATSYTFVLAITEGEVSDVTNGSKIIEESLFVGYTNADLAYTNNVMFYMAPNSISGYGNVRISLMLDNSWTDDDVTELNSLTEGAFNYDVTADLYDISNGRLVYSTIDSPIYGLNKNTPVVFSHVKVTSGIYNFTIKFKRLGSSITYNYSDRIIIYPNQNIDTQFFIPNVIEKSPSAPSDFKAAYCIDSPLYEKTLGDEALYSNYGLLLTWKDNSNNESNFKITLANIANVSTAIEDIPAPEIFTDSDWNNIVGPYSGNERVVKVYDDTYTKSAEYFAGSPEKNNTMLVLLIPFGGCYIAKIEAVNDAGISKACYATIDESFNLKITEDIFNIYNSYAELKGNAFRTSENSSCNVINLYHIVYYLCGGEYFYLENSQSTKSPIVDYGVYGSDKIIRCPIARKIEATVSNPALICGDSRWNAWTENYYGGDLFSGVIESTIEGHSYQKPSAYSGYTSIYLFARYD